MTESIRLNGDVGSAYIVEQLTLDEVCSVGGVKDDQRHPDRQFSAEPADQAAPQVRVESSPADDAPLSAEEASALARHEAVVKRYQRAAFESGVALRSIRDGHLYRGHTRTFEEFCRRRWGMSKTQVNRLIDAAVVWEILTPIGVKVPANEAQARELAILRRPDETIDADKVREVWAQVTRQAEAAGTPVTARMIRQEVQKDEPEPQKLSCVDRALKIVLALSRRDQRKLAKLLRQEWPDVFDSVEAMAESAT